MPIALQKKVLKEKHSHYKNIAIRLAEVKLGITQDRAMTEAKLLKKMFNQEVK